MASYDFIFNGLGLREWCDAGGGGGSLSLADLASQAKGEDADAGASIWNFPLPSMNAFNEACGSFPKSREVTKGLEDGFLAIKDGLSFVLDPITQPLSWMLDGALFAVLGTPWWIVIPLLLLVVRLVSKSWGLVTFVGICLGSLAFIDHYDAAMQTLAIIFVCAFLCVLLVSVRGLYESDESVIGAPSSELNQL